MTARSQTAEAPRHTSAPRAGVDAGAIRRDRLAVGLGALGGAVLVAVLAVPRLGRDPLWLDEAYSLGVTNQFAYGVSESGGTMVAYYALLWLWSLISDVPAWLRALSMFFAMATMWPLAALGRRLGGRRVAVLAPLLLAGAYMFQATSFEARAYAMEIFTVTLCWYLLVRAVDAGTDTEAAKPWWVALTVIAPWGVFMHGLFAVFVAAMVVAVLFSPRPRAALARMWPMLAATGVSLSLLAWLGINRVGEWIDPTELPYVRLTIGTFLGDTSAIRLVTIAALITILVELGRRHRRTVTRRGPERVGGGDLARPAAGGRMEKRRLAVWRLLVPLVWLVVPPVALLSISMVRPVFVDRYLAPVTPAVALIVAWGLNRWVDLVVDRLNLSTRAGIGLVALAGLAMTAGWSIVGQQNIEARPSTHWDDVATLVSERARPGDGLLLYGKRVRPPFEAAWFQLDPDVVPNLVNTPRHLGEVKRFDRYAPMAPSARNRVLAYDRIWAVDVAENDGIAGFYELDGPLHDRYELADSWEFPGRRAPVTVRLYVRDDP